MPGKRQALPRPTAEPMAARMKIVLEPHLSRKLNTPLHLIVYQGLRETRIPVEKELTFFGGGILHKKKPAVKIVIEFTSSVYWNYLGTNWPLERHRVLALIGKY